MNITLAIGYIDGTPRTRVEDDCLVKCGLEGQDSGRAIDTCRQRLVDALSDIHGTSDVEVLFPELGECLQ
jgi:hypothetical protein